MLDRLRESSQGFFGKILFIFLVGLFALWGIGDVFRTGGSANTLVTVGKTTISVQQYHQAVRRHENTLREMMGSKFSPDLLRRLNLKAQVLFGLINDVLLEKEAADLGIVIGDDAVIDEIRNSPGFQGPDGNFDKARYLQSLRENGRSEKGYVEDVRKDMAARLVMDALTSDALVPEALVKAVAKARGEQRVADIIVLPADFMADDVAQPAEKDIQAWYEAHVKFFTAPQTRTVSYIAITPADLQARIQVPEEDIKHAYDERTQEFHKPERRTVEQMLFAKQEDAKEAADKLADGESFAEVAKSSPLINKNKLALGTLAKDEMQAGGNEVFALKQGEVSKPVSSDFGWHVFHVTKIVPESTATLAEVHADLAKDLAARQAQETIGKFVNDLEDTLSGGEDFTHAAQKIGQKVQTVGPFDEQGMTPDGKKAELPPYPDFLKTAFATNEKEHSAATPTPDGSYYLLRVDAATPDRARPLAEVKDKVLAGLRREKLRSKQEEAVKSIAKQLRAGKKMKDVIAEHDLQSPVSSGKIKHDSVTAQEGSLSGKPFPTGLVSELFRRKLHETTEAYARADGGFMIGAVAQVIPASDDAKETDAVRDALKKDWGNEVLRHYYESLRAKYHVSVNEAALRGEEQVEEGGE